MPRLAADEAGDALGRQAGLFGGAHDAAYLVADLTGGVALGLAQRRPLAKRAPALAVRMPAAEWLLAVAAVAALAAELALAVTVVAWAVAALAAELALAVTVVAWASSRGRLKRPLPATPPARATALFMDNNRNLGQFAFSLCIYPAPGRFGLSSAPVPRSRLALSLFPCVLNIY